MKFPIARGEDVYESQIKDEYTQNTSEWKKVWGGWKRGLMGSMAAVLFGTFILVASVMAVVDPMQVKPFEGTTSKKTTPTPVITVNPTPASESGEMVKMETGTPYYLPYPGMLPDNPLYKLKTLRDRIKLTLTMDQVKKAELELFLADKRINSAVFLLNGGKDELAVSTATKAEKYLEQAIDRTNKLSKEGKDVKSLLGKLTKSSVKHLEILEEMQPKVSNGLKEVIVSTKAKTKMLSENVGQSMVEAK